MDGDLERLSYTDRWERTINSDSYDEASNVDSANCHGRNIIIYKEHPFSHIRESPFQFQCSKDANIIAETVYVDRLEHTLALDNEVLSNTSVNVCDLVSEDTDNIIKLSCGMSNDNPHLVYESRDVAKEYDDGSDENSVEHVDRVTTMFQQDHFPDLDLGETLPLHSAERWERTEVKDYLLINNTIKISQLFHPWKYSQVIESLSPVHDAGNNMKDSDDDDEINMEQASTGNKTVMSEVKWSTNVHFHENKNHEEFQVSCLKVNITDENNSSPNTKVVFTHSTQGLQLERRKQISAPDFTTVFGETTDTMEHNRLSDVSNTQSADENIQAVHNLSDLGLSEADTYYTDRWERSELVPDFTDNQIIVSYWNQPWKTSEEPNSTFSINNYDSNIQKEMHQERLHRIVENQEIMSVKDRPLITHDDVKEEQKTLVSSRHLEKRKVIEVGESDFSGAEVRYTSFLNITTGSESKKSEHFVVSELNTTLLKIIDTDIIVRPREDKTSCISELHVNLPLVVSKDEKINHLSDDVSSNIRMACSSNESNVDAGNSFYSGEDTLMNITFNIPMNYCADVPEIFNKVGSKPSTSDTKMSFIKDTELGYRQWGNSEIIVQEQTSNPQFCNTVKQTLSTIDIPESRDLSEKQLQDDQMKSTMPKDVYALELTAHKFDSVRKSQALFGNADDISQISWNTAVEFDNGIIDIYAGDNEGGNSKGYINYATEYVVKQESGDTQYVKENCKRDTSKHDALELVFRQRGDINILKSDSEDSRTGDSEFIKEYFKNTGNVIESERRSDDTEIIFKQEDDKTENIIESESEDSRTVATEIGVMSKNENSEYVMKHDNGYSKIDGGLPFWLKQGEEETENVMKTDSGNFRNRMDGTELVVKQRANATENILENDSEDSARNVYTKHSVMLKSEDTQYLNENVSSDNTESMIKQGNEDTQYFTEDDDEYRVEDDAECVVKQGSENMHFHIENDSEGYNTEYTVENDTYDFSKKSIKCVVNESENTLEAPAQKIIIRVAAVADVRSQSLHCTNEGFDTEYSVENDIENVRKNDTECVVKQSLTENHHKGYDIEYSVENDIFDFRKCDAECVVKQTENTQYHTENGNEVCDTEYTLENDNENVRKDNTECVVNTSENTQYLAENDKECFDTEYNVGNDSCDFSKSYAVCVVKQKSEDTQSLIQNDNGCYDTEYTVENYYENVIKDYTECVVKQGSEDTQYLTQNDNECYDTEYTLDKNKQDIFKDDTDCEVKQGSEDTPYLSKDDAECVVMPSKNTQYLTEKENEGYDTEYSVAIDSCDFSEGDTECVVKQRSEDTQYLIQIDNGCFVTEYTVENGKENIIKDDTECVVKQRSENTQCLTQNDNECYDTEYTVENDICDYSKDETEYVVNQGREDTQSLIQNENRCYDTEYTLENNKEHFKYGTECVVKQSEDRQCLTENDTEGYDTEYTVENDNENVTKDDTECVVNQGREDTQYLIQNDNGCYDTEYTLENNKENIKYDTECVVKQGSEDTVYLTEYGNEVCDTEYIVGNDSCDFNKNNEECLFKQRNEDAQSFTDTNNKCYDTEYSVENDRYYFNKGEAECVVMQSEDTHYHTENGNEGYDTQYSVGIDSCDFREGNAECVVKQRSEDTQYLIQNDIGCFHTEYTVENGKENVIKDDTECVVKQSVDRQYLTENDNEVCDTEYTVENDNEDYDTEYTVENDNENVNKEYTECVVIERSKDTQYFMGNFSKDSRKVDEIELACKQEGEDPEYFLGKIIDDSKGAECTQLVFQGGAKTEYVIGVFRNDTLLVVNEGGEYEMENRNIDSRKDDTKQLGKKEVEDTKYDMEGDCRKDGLELVKQHNEKTDYIMESKSRDDKVTQIVLKQGSEVTEYYMDNVIDNFRRVGDTNFVTNQRSEYTKNLISNTIEDSRICGDTNFMTFHKSEDYEHCIQSDSDSLWTCDTKSDIKHKGKNIELITEHDSEDSRIYDQKLVVKETDKTAEFISMENNITDSRRNVDTECEVKLESEDSEDVIENISDDSKMFSDTEPSIKQVYEGTENIKNCIKMCVENYNTANNCDQLRKDAESIPSMLNARNEHHIDSQNGKESDDTEERKHNEDDNEKETSPWKERLDKGFRLDDTEGKNVKQSSHMNSFLNQTVMQSVSYMVEQSNTQKTDSILLGNLPEHLEQAIERMEHFVHEVKDEFLMKYFTPLVDSVVDSKEKDLGSTNVSRTSYHVHCFPAAKNFTLKHDCISFDTTIKTSNSIDSMEKTVSSTDSGSQNPTATVSSSLLAALNNSSSEDILMGSEEQTITSKINYLGQTKDIGDLLKIIVPLTKCSENVPVKLAESTTATLENIVAQQSGAYSQVNVIMENTTEPIDTGKQSTIYELESDSNVALNDSGLKDDILENNFEMLGNGSNDKDIVKSKQSLVNIENTHQLTTDTLIGGKFYCKVDIKEHSDIAKKQPSKPSANCVMANEHSNSEIVRFELPQFAKKIEETDNVPGLQLQDNSYAKHEHTSNVVAFEELSSENADLDMKSNISSDILTNTLSDLIGWVPPNVESKCLLEDVSRTKSEAEQTVAYSPIATQWHDVQDSTFLPGVSATISEAHILSEFDLLEISSRSQLESLKLAVLEDEKYKSETDQQITVIAERRDILNKSFLVDVSIYTQQQLFNEHSKNVQTSDVKTVLQMQEQYQRSIRDLIAKMEKLNIALLLCLDVPLETGIRKYQEIQQEIRSLKEDIIQIKCIAEQLLNSPNLEAHHTIEATVTMLIDRSRDLETIAENTRRQLQGDPHQLILAAVNKQTNLESAILETENRIQNTEEIYSVDLRLQKWIVDDAEKHFTPLRIHMLDGANLIYRNMEINQGSAAGMDNHEQLVTEISNQRFQKTSSSSQMITVNRIQENWDKLSSILTEKKDNSEVALRTRKSQELVKVSVNAYPRHTESLRQLENVQRNMVDMSESWNQLQKKEKQLQLNELLSFQLQYQTCLQSVSNWLDFVEMQLFYIPVSVEEQITQHKNLLEPIRSLQGEITHIHEQVIGFLISQDGTNEDIIEKSITTLNKRVSILEDAILSYLEDLQKVDEQWKPIKDKIAKLQNLLHDTEKLFLTPVSQDLDQLLSDSQEIEARLKRFESQIEELRLEKSKLLQSDLTAQISNLHCRYAELREKAFEKKVTAQNFKFLHDQYQKLLNEYEFYLGTVQDKLQSDFFTARDLGHLRKQLASHKEFFDDLEVHKAILESLASQCALSTRTKFQQQQSSLTSLTLVLIDQGNFHGQRLWYLCHQWAEFEKKCFKHEKVLNTVESQMPAQVLPGDSLSVVQEKCKKFKQLHSELTKERNSLFEIVDEGSEILHSVTCPTLETLVTGLADKWISMNDHITCHLKSAESLSDQLSVFETEAAILTSWLNATMSKLCNLSQLTAHDLQDIRTIRAKMEDVLELQKEVDSKIKLKNKVSNVGAQLMQNSFCDQQSLSDSLCNNEVNWLKLQSQLSEVYKYLCQAQIHLLPSRQALNEILSWVNEMNRILLLDANNEINTATDIETMVNRYRVYKSELAAWKMILDFVNQQMLDSHAEGHDILNEKMEYVTTLDKLNKDWINVTRDVNERLKSLENVLSDWEVFKTCFDSLHSWLLSQEDEIHQYKMIGCKLQVKHALQELQATEELFETKKSDFTSLMNLGNQLTELSGHEHFKCTQSVTNSLSVIDNKWKGLQKKIKHHEFLLKDALEQWNYYHKKLACLRKITDQIEYALDQQIWTLGDIDILRSKAEIVKNLQLDLNDSNHLESLCTLASHLQQVCELNIQSDIRETVSNIQIKWMQLRTDFTARYIQIEKYLEQWQDFESQCNRICDWITFGENCQLDLINMFDPNGRPEALKKCKQLQQNLDGVQEHISELNRASDHFTKYPNPAAILVISRLSAIDQRMLNLRQNLSKNITALTQDVATRDRFKEAVQVVEHVLTNAAGVLAEPDPISTDKKIIKERLAKIKQLVLLFINDSINLDTINNLRHNLSLDEANANRLRDLNHEWQKLYKDAIDRTRILQSLLPLHQDFTSKCKMWMTFVTKTEQDLAVYVNGNLNDLLDQLHICQLCESEIFAREHILHALITDGEKMMTAGEVDETFHQKLHLMVEQFQSMCTRANQKKALIKMLISQWQEFSVLCQGLKSWLHDKEKVLKNCESDLSSLQMITVLREKVQNIKQELRLHETMHQKMCDLGNTLLLHADKTEAVRIKDTVTSLQHLWDTVLNSLDDNQLHLDNLHQECLECEKVIDDLLNWLRNAHVMLHKDIPKTHGELINYLSSCEDTLSGFINLEDKHQDLLTKEKEMFRLNPRDGFNILHEQIQLLDKLWVELQQQAILREQKVKQALSRWTNFGERMKSIVDWTDSFIEIVGSNKDMHVDDLSTKINIKFKQKLLDKELEKEEVILQGRQLMKISSEIQATDIDLKLAHLEEKWQKLNDILNSRQQKLQEIVSTVIHSDTSLKNLNQWLLSAENQPATGALVTNYGLGKIKTKFRESQIENSTVFNAKGKQYFQSESATVHRQINTDATFQLELKPVKSLAEIQNSFSTLRNFNSSVITTRSSDERSESSFLLRSPTLSLATHTSQLSSGRFSTSPSRQTIKDDIDGQASARQDIEKSSRIEILLHQLVESLDNCDVKLTRFESALSANVSMEQKILWYIKCETTVDHVMRQNQLIKTETGFMAFESIDAQFMFLLQRWENLKRLTIQQDFKVSNVNYDDVRFAKEIDGILTWLSEAEVLQSLHQSLPSDIAQLDVIIRQFKDFKIQLESKKISVLTINLLSFKYLEANKSESMQLQEKIDEMNSRWQLVLSRAKHRETNLQVSLIQCQEFHHKIHDYQLWLEDIEICIHTCEPIHLNADDSATKKYARLLELTDELQRSQPQLMSLRDTADQVLMSTGSLEVAIARSKVHTLHSHMQSLVGLISCYRSALEKRLQTSSNEGNAPLSGVVSPVLQSENQEKHGRITESETAGQYKKHAVCTSLLMRVIHAALPIYLLFLLLFLLFCLLPVCEDEYQCTFGNNLHHSISPMLRYTDGAPPT